MCPRALRRGTEATSGDRIPECPDGGQGDAHLVARVQREVVGRDDARPGHQVRARGKPVLAEQPVGERRQGAADAADLATGPAVPVGSDPGWALSVAEVSDSGVAIAGVSAAEVAARGDESGSGPEAFPTRRGHPQPIALRRAIASRARGQRPADADLRSGRGWSNSRRKRRNRTGASGQVAWHSASTRLADLGRRLGSRSSRAATSRRSGSGVSGASSSRGGTARD